MISVLSYIDFLNKFNYNNNNILKKQENSIFEKIEISTFIFDYSVQPQFPVQKLVPQPELAHMLEQNICYNGLNFFYTTCYIIKNRYLTCCVTYVIMDWIMPYKTCCITYYIDKHIISV